MSIATIIQIYIYYYYVINHLQYRLIVNLWHYYYCPSNVHWFAIISRRQSIIFYISESISNFIWWPIMSVLWRICNSQRTEVKRFLNVFCEFLSLINSQNSQTFTCLYELYIFIEWLERGRGFWSVRNVDESMLMKVSCTN